MSYLLPSYFQKRILRYALSKVDFLDAEQLNPNKFDIAWGRRSVIELRDVGVQLERLASLLNLPQRLVLIKARIKLLRVTIPADLYSSGIVAEIEGFELHIDAEPELRKNRGGVGLQSEKHEVTSAKQRMGTDHQRSLRPKIHDPGGVASNPFQGSVGDDKSSESAVLPTTDDLAKSFLQSEPKEERAQLQEAVAHSHHMGEMKSLGGSDEAAAVGVGNGLSLPAFLSGFLKGIGDRFRLSVKDVKVDLSLRLDSSPESLVASAASERSERVTLRLSVKDVEYWSVPQPNPDAKSSTSQSSDWAPSSSTSSSEAPFSKRHLRLSNIWAAVLSDPSIFSDSSRSLARSSSSESTAAGSPPKAPQKTERRGHEADHSTTDSDDGTKEQAYGLTSETYVSSDSENVSDTMRDAGAFSHSAITAAATQGIEHDDLLLDPSYSDGEGIRSEYNSIHDSSASSRLLPSVASDSPANDSRYAAQKTALTPSRNGMLGSRGPSPVDDRHSKFSNTESPSPGEKYTPSPPGEDLAESKIFSHEEAESMYMSAMSNASPLIYSTDRTVPGAWKASGEEDETEQISPAINIRSETSQPTAGRTLPGLDPSDARIDGSNIMSFGTDSTNHTVRLMGTYAPQRDGSQSTPNVQPSQPTPSHESEPSDTASTGSLIVSRTFMFIDYITISVPQTDTNSTPSSAPSTQPAGKVPMSSPSKEGPQVRFSQTTALGNADGSSYEQGQESIGKLVPGHHAKNPDMISGTATAAEVGEVEFMTDMSLARLITVVIRQMHTMTPANATSHEQDSSKKTDLHSQTKLSIKKLGWKFFDRVVSSPAHVPLDTSAQLGKRDAFVDSELLLRAAVHGLESTLQTTGASYSSKLSMARVAFGYAAGDIISFDPSLKLRESTRDVLAPVDTDVVLTVSRDARASKIELSTLPLDIRLDLRRLDETFAWLGGLSSILDLGNSMISTVTNLDRKPPDSKGALRPRRGVRFHTPLPGKSAKRNVGQEQVLTKVTARIGGLTCILQGSESSLRLEGTALKGVSRAEGLGLQVDRLNLSGPNVDNQVSPSAMVVQLSNVRVEFLPEPKEVDLARLLALLSPSRDRYEVDDDILLDTLLRQRRQGSVIRFTAERCESHITSMDDLSHLPVVAEELKKLATVTKYLPEDDQPGILTLALIRQFRCDTQIDHSFGFLVGDLQNIEVAHVTLPSLVALGISSLHFCRNTDEELLAATSPNDSTEQDRSPMILARFIGDEMEPTVKLKLQHLRIEYQVPFVLAIMDLTGSDQPEDLLSDVAGSIATLTAKQHRAKTTPGSPQESYKSSGKSGPAATAMRVDVAIKDSMIGLNPRKSPAKGVLLLTEAHFVSMMPKDQEANAVLEVQKAALLVIDDRTNFKQQEQHTEHAYLRHAISQLQTLEAMGYVSVSSISAARASLQVVHDQDTSTRSIDVDIKDDLFVLESCADSTQTLQTIFKGLTPPLPPSRDVRYRTEVVPIEDLLSSFSGIALNSDGEKVGQDEEKGFQSEVDHGTAHDENPEDLDMVGSVYDSQTSSHHSGLSDSILDDDSGSVLVDPSTHDFGEALLASGLIDQSQTQLEGPALEFQDDHFGSSTSVGGTAHRWNTQHNTYGLANETRIQRSPLKVRIRDVHVIWNLFDGYDWQQTRDTIGRAIADVETKALDRLAKRDKRKSQDVEDDEGSVIGDFLFNSIYIGIPANRDPRSLSREVNHGIEDTVSETESSAPSTVSSSPSHPHHTSPAKSKRLRLARSKHHKMTFELKGISADLVVFPPGSGETQSSIDVRVQDLEIFDHVPTSTWKKFATYMHDAGERESGTSMIHLEILNVRPVADLAASEIILKATILPLRLHVDQDALDFMTRFFEFKDDTAPESTSKSEAAFLQRVEVNSVRLRLDFKPKRVDYAGIRSGHTNEFMNFFILDRADMVLRHVIIYGISGFDRLGKTLNDIWMPDIKRNQLPGVLAGLAPVRSLVNVGSGVRDLVVVPIREYQKDGRIVRSLQKGALMFAKTTTNELVKLGAKLAIGTQTVLTGAEDLLTQPGQQRTEIAGGWEEAELDEDEKKHISLYADQPVGVIQGLRGAYASLERDLLMAKDAVVAMPGEVMESGTAGGAAKAVLKGAPTIILRPALGVSKAVGQTLMGATNSLDPANRRRIEEASGSLYRSKIAQTADSC
ncbi:MAG: hypothetical protein Q9181_004739 [Wetmoreana brouardii]